MREIITLNGVCFENIGDGYPMTKGEYESISNFGIGDYDLFNIYKYPSDIKIRIWKNWLEWAQETKEVVSFYVDRGNCSFFSIGGVVVIDNVPYTLRITHTRHTLSRCNIVD